MSLLNWEFNLFLQGMIAAIMIGVFYSLWVTSRAYGGLIGYAIRLLGVGIVLISAAVLEKMLVNFSVVSASVEMSLAQDFFTLAGLVFLAAGFKKLATIAKV